MYYRVPAISLAFACSVAGDSMYFNDKWNRTWTHGIPKHDIGVLIIYACSCSLIALLCSRIGSLIALLCWYICVLVAYSYIK